jgi:hypothetical protein
MAKRVVEVRKLGELCFAVWTGATSKDKPSVINVGTHDFVALGARMVFGK